MSVGSVGVLKVGDRIWFEQPRKGGYGWPDFDVPGTLVGQTPHRCIVELECVDGTKLTRKVSAHRIRRRVADRKET